MSASISNVAASNEAAAAAFFLSNTKPLARLDAAVDKTTVSNYRPASVNAVFSKVKAVFEQPVVWKNDLTEISTQLDRLSPRERQSLVNLMARTASCGHLSLLTCWLNRATHQSLAAFDGLCEKARNHLWKQLVVGQDKANLVRIFHATSDQNNPSIKEGEYHPMQFAKAVAATCSPQQRMDFVSALLPNAIAWSKDASTNKSGRAIAVVMATMTDPAQISACVKMLGREGMDAVVQASLPTRDAGTIPGLEPVDTKMFRGLAATIARSSIAREKAAFVSAAGPVLETLNNAVIGPNKNREPLKEITEAISTVIGTDTTGVIENVMMQNTAQNRSSGPAALRAYARAVLDSGRGVDLGAITLQLQRGNDLKGEPNAYLGQKASRSGEEPTYARARVMGGWLGLMGSAVQTRINRRDSNAAYSSLLFSGTVDIMKELVGARFPGFKMAAGVAAPALKTAINLALFNWRNEATKSDRTFAQGLIEGALPRHRNGVESTSEWTLTLKTEQSRRFSGS